VLFFEQVKLLQVAQRVGLAVFSHIKPLNKNYATSSKAFTNPPQADQA
jgi:hypothetical protein